MIWILITGFILMNMIAFFHAFKFTHFGPKNIDRTESPENLNSLDKIKTLLFGINNPRPINEKMPSKFKRVELQSNKKIECWQLNKDDFERNETIIGTIILFHGYSVGKSTLLDQASEFEKLKYDVLLVDFMGSGGSEGNQTTLGFKEAEQVKTAYDYLTIQGFQNIYLFGTSMGSVAIMKAIADYNLKLSGIIIECPFGSMYLTTCSRFKIMKAPSIPMAGLLVFWGGVQNGFWAFGHSPKKYAKKINIPTLLLYGGQDETVSKQETDQIYNNLKGAKKMITYELAGHESYLNSYRENWKSDIATFLTIN